jgi:hypothetical protein
VQDGTDARDGAAARPPLAQRLQALLEALRDAADAPRVAP